MEEGYRWFIAPPEKSEAFDKERLRSFQYRELKKLLHHAREQIPEYKDRLSPLIAGVEDPTPSKWHEASIGRYHRHRQEHRKHDALGRF